MAEKFGHLDIGANPTELRAKFHIFHIDFSAIGCETHETFADRIRNSVSAFVAKYPTV